MTYQTGSINSVYPARDVMAAVQPVITGGGLSLVESYNPPAGAWSQVCYGGGQFVAVATGSATAITSPNGITWTARSLPQIASWSSVAYGNGVYVAIAANSTVAATSPDGITWTARTLTASANWTSVAYGNGTFVVVGNGTANVLTSPDGQTWTTRTGVITSTTWMTLAFGGTGNLFVALSTSATAAATSPDGVTWTPRTLTTTTWVQVTGTATGFVAVSSSGSYSATSADGTTWTARANMPVVANGATFNTVTYGGGMYTALASGSNAAATSPDAITWTARTLPLVSGWSSVAYGGGVFAALTNTNTGAAASSTDGITWTQRATTGTSTSPTVDVYKSAAAGNQAGADWYLLLRRAGDNQTQVYYQVAENYSSVTHQATGFGGVGSSGATPTPGSYLNPMTASGVDQASMYGTSATVQCAASTATTWQCSATVNRVVIALRATAGGTEYGCYLGLYDDLLPPGVTVMPLVAAKIPVTAVLASAIGGGTTTQTGGFTREPLQTGALFQNFEAAVHNSYVAPPGVATLGYSWLSTTAALYGNTNTVSRVPVGSARPATTADAMRGLLIGCVASTVTAAIGDTVAVGAKTYVRFGGPTTTYGICVDQGL